MPLSEPMTNDVNTLVRRAEVYDEKTQEAMSLADEWVDPAGWSVVLTLVLGISVAMAWGSEHPPLLWLAWGAGAALLAVNAVKAVRAKRAANEAVRQRTNAAESLFIGAVRLLATLNKENDV